MLIRLFLLVGVLLSAATDTLKPAPPLIQPSKSFLLDQALRGELCAPAGSAHADLSAGMLGDTPFPVTTPSLARREPVAESRTTTLAVPGRSNSNVSLDARGDLAAVVWTAATPAGAADAFAAVSRDGGRTFGDPVRVNDVAGEVRASGEMPPRIVIRQRAGAEPELVAAWTSKRESTTIRIARSMDTGRSFAASMQVSEAAAPGDRGWHGMAVDANGNVDVVWLDHRGLAAQSGAAHDHHKTSGEKATEDGVAMAQRSGLYLARLGASGLEPERRLTTGVCYCCKTAIAGDSSGVVAAWRHVYEGNIRDIAFTRSVDGRTFTPPARVSHDEWELDGCPDDGPAVALDGSGRTHLVWPTLVTEGEPTIALFYTFSVHSKAFTGRTRIPTEGLPHHPQIATLRDGSIGLTWDELQAGARRVVLTRVRTEPSGAVTFGKRLVLSGSEPSFYPVVGAVSSGALTAWTAGQPKTSVIRLRRMTD